MTPLAYKELVIRPILRLKWYLESYFHSFPLKVWRILCKNLRVASLNGLDSQKPTLSYSSSDLGTGCVIVLCTTCSQQMETILLIFDLPCEGIICLSLLPARYIPLFSVYGVRQCPMGILLAFCILQKAPMGGGGGRGSGSGRGSTFFHCDTNWPGTCSSIVCVGYGVDPGLGHGGLMHYKGTDLVHLPLPLPWAKSVQLQTAVHIVCTWWPWIVHWSLPWAALICLFTLAS